MNHGIPSDDTSAEPPAHGSSPGRPGSGAARDFYDSEGELLATEPSAILREFIAEEDWALSTGRQGLIWPMNHQRIKPLIGAAPGLLPPAELRRLHLHLFRLGHEFPRPSAEEYALMRAAYSDYLAIQASGDATRSTDTGHPTGAGLRWLLLFGFDERGPLAGQSTESHDRYVLWRKVWDQCSAYVAVPNMLAKVHRFSAYADDPLVARRVLATLRHVRYAHGFDRIELPFWGMVLIVLLSGGEARDELLGDVADLLPEPRRDTESTAGFRSVFRRYRDATGA